MLPKGKRERNESRSSKARNIRRRILRTCQLDLKPVHQSQIQKHHESCGNIDYVLPNALLFSMRTALYTFEDNDAVITPINRGRSPTMRHISRTHRIDLDWWYDRIDLDSMIQIKYVNTIEHLADILTKGSFTRDRWPQLNILVNIMKNTTFTQSNLSLSSAGVNPVFFQHEQTIRRCICKRQTETISLHRHDCEQSERQECPHGLSRSTFTRLQSWRRLHARRIVSAKSQTNSPLRRLEHQKALGGRKRLEQYQALRLRTRRNRKPSRWCCTASVQHFGWTSQTFVIFIQHSVLEPVHGRLLMGFTLVEQVSRRCQTSRNE